jgi:hypothetical protein
MTDLCFDVCTIVYFQIGLLGYYDNNGLLTTHVYMLGISFG